MISGINPLSMTPGLRFFSKLTCGLTLFLIFVGGMVTSTGSGLAVPDWPLSYGTLFPPMIGGVFYEHGHRMVASLAGFLTLVLAFWLNSAEKRCWVKCLGWTALLAVILQGILGGMTVLFYLPTPISVSHGILAQTFFVLTIILAYSQSQERQDRERHSEKNTYPQLLRTGTIFFGLIYIQLILGAIMRHTGSGLAIPDFPMMGGKWLPTFDARMLDVINAWRFDHDLDPVTMHQIFYHFSHRLGACFILICLCIMNIIGLKYSYLDEKVKFILGLLNIFVLLQITLGITTVLTLRSPVITSLHVVMGAAILGTSTVLLLRLAPVSFKDFQHAFTSSQ